MEDHSSPFVSEGSVRSIKFSISTMEEISTYSVSDCPVSHPSQLTNPFLGLPLESGKCESCGTAEHGKCEGHFGYIQLPVPVYHPTHVSELKHILGLICLKCMRMKKGKVNHKLGKETISTSSCFYCRDLPPISIKEVKTTDGALCLQLRVPARTKLYSGFWSFLDKFGYHYGEDSFCRPLLPYEAFNILKELPEETKKRLSGKGYFPQDGFILQRFPVPPNCLYVPEISDGKSVMSSDISISMLKRVLTKIELIKRSRTGSPNFESHEVESNDLQSSILNYMHLRGTPKAPHDITKKYIANTNPSECSAKQWLEKMRTLFIKKGSGFSSRSVITGDAYIGIDQIGLPSEIAQRVTFEERVTVHNLKRLQKMVDDRLCVTYRDGLSAYAFSVGSKGHTVLKVGQIVNRQIMDGDTVFINRPPSTHKHSLQAFSVYIHDDHTVKINPLICAPLGADFDGDCVHIFYPQSLASKAEVLELFSVENQLVCSHNGNLNLQLAHDSLLALRLLFNASFFKQTTAQQLAMFLSPILPAAALTKGHKSGPLWTVLQLLQGALPAHFDCFGERHLINQSEILKLDFNKDVLHSSFTEIIASILMMKGPQDALKFFNTLQPLLMEMLFSEGFSITLKDFHVPNAAVEGARRSVQEISSVLHQLRSTSNDLIELQLENHLKASRQCIEPFILNLSAMGKLIDSSSVSAIMKVAQQVGFLGLQLYDKGKFYSKALVDDIFSHFVSKYSVNGADHPSEAYGLVRNSFFHGLSSFEALVHSISSREVIVRSSRGLTEPGTLFKNLMAILRDVVICYDGTVRNVCNNSIVQLNYGVDSGVSSLRNSPPGEPVGVLAATAISTPAYKAVLDSSQSTISSWELMKEILLVKVNYQNVVNDRRVILYLNDCSCGKKFCKENAAFAAQNYLKRITLKDCASEFSIEYQSQTLLRDSSETPSGLVGHIHLDKIRLRDLNQSMDDILQKCQDVISSHGKKKGNLRHFFRKICLSASECTEQSNDWNFSRNPCLQFSYYDGSESLERIMDIMATVVYPILLDTIVKGDPRVHIANIVWIGPDAISWVRSSQKTLKGELAVEVVIEKDAVRQNGDAWRTALDACLPIMHLIDTRRSIPYGVQQVQELLGISCAFDQSVQRLSTSIKMVAKGVLKEHFILVGNSMTCTGNIIGFNTGGFKAMFKSLKVQVPFTEATLFKPMKCFERAADKCYTDSLASIVSSCSWGKHVAVGTGNPFQIMWDKDQMANDRDARTDVYDFLELVRTTSSKMDPTSVCLGADVDELVEDDETDDVCLSPELDSGSRNAVIFDDSATPECNTDNNTSWENEGAVRSDWENVSAPELGWDSWNGQKNGNRSNPVKQPQIIDNNTSWGNEGIGKSGSENVSGPEVTWDSWNGHKNGNRPNLDKQPQIIDSNTSWENESLGKSSWENVSAPEVSRNSWNGRKNDNQANPDKPQITKPSVWSSWDDNKAQQSIESIVTTKEADGFHSSGNVEVEMRPRGSDHSDAWDNCRSSTGETETNIWNKNVYSSPKGTHGNNPSYSKPEIWGNQEGKSANQEWKSRGWGSSKDVDTKSRQNQFTRPVRSNDRKGWNQNGNFASTSRRVDLFSTEEETILVDVQPTIDTIKRIIRDSSDGEKLVGDDEKFVMEKVFQYHPDRQSKVCGQIDCIMVDRNEMFVDTRCFYVVSSDGSRADFSYKKCIENYVKDRFPDHADSFGRKFFRKRGSEAHPPSPVVQQ